MAEPLVITVVLNSNRREDTLCCLASLAESTHQRHKVIVADNASSDGSVEAIRAGFPQVEVISLIENRGYAGNNNVGIAAALERGADWVFVLNEDTVVAPDCIAQLVSTGESDPSIGIVGPMVYHHDEPQVIQSAGGMLGPCWESVHLGKNEPDRQQFSAPHAVDWISGCGLLVRRSVIEQVGLIDERYFIYWEETEWCIRAGRAGWRIMHVPQARIWHKGVRRDYRPTPHLTYYFTRNKLLTLSKHHAPLLVWVGSWLQLLRTVISWSVRPKWKSMRSHRAAMCLGIRDFLRRRWGGPVRL
jgi:GT2 family glycosyltransferase